VRDFHFIGLGEKVFIMVMQQRRLRPFAQRGIDDFQPPGLIIFEMEPITHHQIPHLVSGAKRRRWGIPMPYRQA
jgi:hypothetical protein